ncbi:MAG: histidine kinase [Bacteroidia bacterium]|nr:histidine kinase [Bacteroidia bacterium]
MVERQSLLKKLSSRVALNMYFWLMMFFIKSPTISYVTGYSVGVYYGLIVYFLGLLAIMSYVHNLILLPKFFFTKKYVWYTLFTLAWLFVMAYFYTYSIKYLPALFPGLEVLRMSIVMSPVSNDLSFSGVVNDIQTYFFVMLMWLFIFALLAIFHQSREKLKRMEKAILAHKEQELAFLKSQLNPHFLFNTLNNIYGLSLKGDARTSDVIIKLSSVLRYLLYESDAKTVQFYSEKEVLFSYVDLELLRLGDSTSNSFSVYADKNYEIPPLLWLPILENVFKHTRHLSDKKIDFRWIIESNKMSIFSSNAYSDNGIADRSENGNGIGLGNLRKRLDLLFPNAYQLREDKQDQTYTIEMEINLLGDGN